MYIHTIHTMSGFYGGTNGLQDHTYYSLNFRNSGIAGNAEFAVINYEEIRNSPYLINPQDYYLSVVRFSMSTSTLPILVPEVLTESTNTLVYSVTMSNPTLLSGAPVQTYVVYTPQSNVPKAPFSAGQNSQYWYIYQVPAFIQMVNTALATCYDTLHGAPPAGSGLYPPYLTWDSALNVATFHAADDEFNEDLVTAGSPTGTSVFFNSALFQLFNSFPAYVANVVNNSSPATISATAGRHFRFQFFNFYNSLEVAANTYTQPEIPPCGAPVAAKLYLSVVQQYSSVPSMNPVKSIVFLTSLLPVNPENVSQPEAAGTGRGFQSNGNNANIATVLTDFEVDLVTGQEYRPFILYTPTAEYRLVDLMSNQELKAIQISVAWRNSFGQIVPMFLGSNGNAQIKMMFRRKDFRG